MISDSELLQAWRGGDRRAGHALFSRHFDSVYRFFGNKLDDPFEDLVQRTFMACLEGRDRFREEASFRTYLFAIANNLLRDALRAKYARREVDFEVTSVTDLGAGPGSVLAAREQAHLVLHALRRIPIDAQVLLELYYWEELTGPELARFLDVPEDTARSRLRRAKVLLRRAVAEAELRGWALSGSVTNLERWARELRRQFAPAR